MPPNTPPTPTSSRGQRSDARRNVSAILDAATSCLQRDPDVSLADIAAAAGVGRITVYGHFRARADLVEAVFEHTIARADAVLQQVETSDDPAEDLARLIASSWQVVDQSRSILQAALRELPAKRIRQSHDHVIARIADIVERGRAQGAFRTDLPTDWLISVILGLIHTSAAEVDAGRVDPAQVGDYLMRTVLSALGPPRGVHGH